MGRRILAIIGLVHCLVFSVTFIMYLIAPDMFNGLSYLVGYSAIMSLLISCYFWLAKKDDNK